MPEKILIVDDDVDTLRLVGLMLQRQGYQIIAASGGQQALFMVESEKPDLVILDVMMPDMDGYEVTRRLRSSPATAPIPIIMFTAKSQVDDKVNGFDVGADDYLTKPTQPRELFAHVKAVLARTSKAAVQPQPSTAEKGRVVGVLTAKGGTGGSTMAINLGAALSSRFKKKVLVAELRPGEGSIGLDLGYSNQDSLTRLLSGDSEDLSPGGIENDLTSHSTGLRLLLSSYQPQDAWLNNKIAESEALVQQLAYLSEVLILDLGPGLPEKTEKILPLCDSLILVTEPLPSTVVRTRALLDRLGECGFSKGRIHITLVSRQRSEMHLSWSQVQEQLGHAVDVTFTPAPEQIYQAARASLPAVLHHPESLLSQQYAKLCDSVLKTARQKA
jgi:DNA-binding response OmpR family regulator